MNIAQFLPHSAYAPFFLWLAIGYFVYIIIPWLGWRPQKPSMGIIFRSVKRVFLYLFLLYFLFMILDFIAFLLIQYILHPLNITTFTEAEIFFIARIIKWIIAVIFMYIFIIGYRPYVPSAILPFGLAFIILPCTALVGYITNFLFNIITYYGALPLQVPTMPWMFTPNFNWITFCQVAILALGLELMYRARRPIFSFISGFIYFWGIEILVNQWGKNMWIILCIIPIIWLFMKLRTYTYKNG